MNDELAPLGLPHSTEELSRTLTQFVADRPLVALAASAAIGAGVMALVALAVRQSGRASPDLADSLHASDAYGELRKQFAKLTERVNAALPDKGDLTKTLSDLGSTASSSFGSASDTAQRALRSALASGSKATQAAADHPLLTSLLVGAVGAVGAAIAASANKSSEQNANAPAPNGHDREGAAHLGVPTTP